MASTDDIVTVFGVDDDEPTRDSIKVLLEIHGYEVADFVWTSEFAVNYRTPQRGCLILDQHLSVMTGPEFLATATGRNLGIPVILIAGYTNPRLERAREAGVPTTLKAGAQRSADRDCRACREHGGLIAAPDHAPIDSPATESPTGSS